MVRRSDCHSVRQSEAHAAREVTDVCQSPPCRPGGVGPDDHTGISGAAAGPGVPVVSSSISSTKALGSLTIFCMGTGLVLLPILRPGQRLGVEDGPVVTPPKRAAPWSAGFGQGTLEHLPLAIRRPCVVDPP